MHENAGKYLQAISQLAGVEYLGETYCLYDGYDLCRPVISTDDDREIQVLFSLVLYFITVSPCLQEGTVCMVVSDGMKCLF